MGIRGAHELGMRRKGRRRHVAHRGEGRHEGNVRHWRSKGIDRRHRCQVMVMLVDIRNSGKQRRMIVYSVVQLFGHGNLDGIWRSWKVVFGASLPERRRRRCCCLWQCQFDFSLNINFKFPYLLAVNLDESRRGSLAGIHFGAEDDKAKAL